MRGADCQLEKLREFPGNDSKASVKRSHHQGGEQFLRLVMLWRRVGGVSILEV
jgi:hypothetical protein